VKASPEAPLVLLLGTSFAPFPVDSIRTPTGGPTMKAPARKSQTSSDIAAGYNAFKEFEGKRYTGMKIGRSHKWYYDQGEWKEKKVTPDNWEFTYNVKKRRAGKAPEGSGVPVGTAYHWYILAHQTVTKLNANDYETAMSGMKYKLAHRRADKETWSASERAQRNRLIKLLHEMLEDLEKQAAADPGRTPARKRVAAKAAPRKHRPTKRVA
jgi:hypothetical protein